MWGWFRSDRQAGADQAWWRLIDRSAVEVADDAGEIVELRAGRVGPATARGLVLDFRYVDAAGAPTRRGLLCYRCFAADGRLYVSGYCPFREAFRTFRVDRMRDLVDVTDGSQVPIDDIAGFFLPMREDGPADETVIADPPDLVLQAVRPAAAQKAAKALDQYLFKAARRDCVAGLRIIEAVVKSDGVRSVEERTLLRSFLESRLAMRGFAFNPALAQALMDYAATLVPPANLAKAIAEVVEDRAYFELVYGTATDMGNIEGKQRQLVDDILVRLEGAGGEAGWL